MRARRSSLFRKQVLLIGSVVLATLLTGGAVAFSLFVKEQQRQLFALQTEKALGAAAKIESLLRSIESQLEATATAPFAGVAAEDTRLELLRLLQRVPTVFELTLADRDGRERLFLSRVATNRSDSRRDLSANPAVVRTLAEQRFQGDVYFRNGTEPFVTVGRRLATGDGVLLAEVSLKSVWDVVGDVHLGRGGYGYVVDGSGVLIAHPDLHRVLQKTNLSEFAQVRQALKERDAPAAGFASSLSGQEVLSAHAAVGDTGWMMFVEIGRAEALRPAYSFAWRGLAILIFGSIASVLVGMLLAHRILQPVAALRRGVDAIRGGDLQQRIDVRTGDELQELADDFNAMAGRLQELYATMEQKVQARTQELEQVNLAKSRFLAAASHDLRQPMHALNLYLASLSNAQLEPDARRLLAHVRDCAESLDDLFDSLLDISRLESDDAYVRKEAFALDVHVEKVLREFQPEAALSRTRLRFRASAAECGVFSDPTLVERVARNLISNAVRYTVGGSILVTCRRRGPLVQLAVRDTGSGIPLEQQDLIFEEFYQIGNPARDRKKGLGLGLSIVKRIAKLLDTQVSLFSRPGQGSCFLIELIAAPLREAGKEGSLALHASVRQGAPVVVIDDELTVLHATCTLLEQWGWSVIAAPSVEFALQQLASVEGAPQLLICDLRLAAGATGVDAVERLRDEFNEVIPSLIVTGEAAPAQLKVSALHASLLLKKPLSAQRLRAGIVEVLQATCDSRDLPIEQSSDA